MMIFTIVFYLFRVLSWYRYLMIIWVFSSWLPSVRDIGIIRFIGRMVEPFFNIFRRLIPSFGGMDLSPIIAFLMYDWGLRSLAQIITMLLQRFL
ncbi:MAG: YggT family protein [Turicibacter sp.]|nr:YggT family protein [Turicibacter sp.]